MFSTFKSLIRRGLLKLYRSIVKPIRLIVIPENSRFESLALKIYLKVFPVDRSLQNNPSALNQPGAAQNKKRTPEDYAGWIKENEPGIEDLVWQTEQSAHFSSQPLISIITPVYNPPIEVIKSTSSSVCQQSYPNWEWCIANGSVENEELNQFLEALSQSEPRIRIKNLESNRGISANTNEAIVFARGEYIAFLDHDDLLSPDALFEVAKVINENPDVDLVYSDEDRTSADCSARYDPCFRPEFSPEVLRSNNYMPHLVVMRKTLGKEVGWLRSDFDGSQDHDLLLRTTERAKQILHIPKILYHWRAIEGSAALSNEAKPYTHHAGRKAVQEHVSRIGRQGTVEDGHDPNYHRVRYVLPPNAAINILIPYAGKRNDSLIRCVNSILESTQYRQFDIHVLYSGSLPPQNFLKELPMTENSVTLIKNEPGTGLYSLINQAVAEIKGDYFALLDHRMEIFNPEWLSSLLEHAIWSENGVIGGMVISSDQRISNAGYTIGGRDGVLHRYRGLPKNWAGYFGMLKYPHNCSAVSGAFMLMSKAVFRDAGQFDERYQTTLGDVDLCLKVIAKGYQNIWTPYASARLQTQDSQLWEPNSGDEKYFQQKWEDFLRRGDPYYSPNLSLEKVDYSIRVPKTEE